MTVRLIIHRDSVLLEASFFYHTLGVVYCRGWQVFCVNNARARELERALERKWGLR